MRDGILTESLDLLVTALCLDYFRRKEAMENKSVTKRTDTEFRYYNFKIFDAVAEVGGERYAELYIKEIGRKTGYAKSELSFLSEGTYKRYKAIIKENIARKLHLVDELF
jgi:hypothetical protein